MVNWNICQSRKKDEKRKNIVNMCEKHYVKIYLQLSSNPNKKRIFPQNLNVWILKMVGPENLLEKNKKK